MHLCSAIAVGTAWPAAADVLRRERLRVKTSLLRLGRDSIDEGQIREDVGAALRERERNGDLGFEVNEVLR